jgi:hypothetical protein
LPLLHGRKRSPVKTRRLASYCDESGAVTGVGVLSNARRVLSEMSYMSAKELSLSDIARAKLRALCHFHGLNKQGTKAELAARIEARPTCPQQSPQLQADDDQDQSFEYGSSDQEDGCGEDELAGHASSPPRSSRHKLARLDQLGFMTPNEGWRSSSRGGFFPPTHSTTQLTNQPNHPPTNQPT